MKILKQFEKVTNLVTLRLAELINELMKQGRYSDDFKVVGTYQPG